MSTVIQNIETATSGVQFLIGQVANALSPQAKAISDFILGQPALLASWADLVQKADNGTATWEDIIEPTIKLQGLLSATALLAATPGAQPAAVIVGAAAAALFIWKQRDVIANADATVKSYFENRYAQLENSIRDEFGMSRIFEPPVIAFTTNTAFTSALTWTQPRDPLILDLDGDGIELTASSSSVLFDHNADGLKTGTQWAKGDDGMLVRDINGNGLIDSGRELFGDQTVYTSGPRAGELAINGFEALRALDRDASGFGNGVFNAGDAAYGELRIWRDVNQDGISQAHELQTLAGAGVKGIHLAANAQGVGSFVKSTSTVTTALDTMTGEPDAAISPIKPTTRLCKARHRASKNRLNNHQKRYAYSSFQCQ